MDVRLLKVVLASPSDTRDERNAVTDVADEVNQMLRQLGLPYRLEVYRWEIDASPGLDEDGPQARIDKALDIARCDLLIGIFFRRFGTPVRELGSGTEHEIVQAINSWTERQSPQVMLYFNDIAFEPTSPDEKHQFEGLKQFQSRIISMNNALVAFFPRLEEFRSAVRRDLLRFVSDIHGNRSAPLEFSARNEVAHLRSEGYTELIGDIFLDCTYVSEMVGLLWFSVLIHFNTAITSRLSNGSSDGLSEITLTDATSPTPDVYFGRVQGNQVAFDHVFLKDMKLTQTRTFRISNIRCNANVLYPIVAYVSVGPQRVKNAILSVGRSSEGFKCEAEIKSVVHLKEADDGFLRFCAYTPIDVCFTEKFAGAFKARHTSMALFSSDELGVISSAESGSLGPRVKLAESSKLAGDADTGTVFELCSEKINSHIRVFASTRNIAVNHDGPEAQVINRTTKPDKDRVRLIIDGTEYCEVDADPYVAVRWEMRSRKHNSVASIKFKLVLLVERIDSSDIELLEDEYWVTGNLATWLLPPSASNASAKFPIPRFWVGGVKTAKGKYWVPNIPHEISR